MLKFFSKLFSKKQNSIDEILKYPEGRRYYRESHPIRKHMIDDDALKIIHRLNKYGYKSYIVGGGVRDLLLGKKPKDFDIVTNATPNQIKSIFNNCRIIGKRFKIVHVLFKGKIIEVSTFRSIKDYHLTQKKDDRDYLIKRDNKFGNPKEDAARRDFTINSLYFEPRNESIIDFVGGFEDLQNKILTVIGDPDISFKEDPVRMLRAVKFSIMHGFEIDKRIKTAIKKNRMEINKASNSRMIEEYNKIFRTWKTSLIFKGLAENHLLEILFEEAFQKSQKEDIYWTENFFQTPVGKRLVVADRLLSEREELTSIIFFAILFHDLTKVVLNKDEGSLAQALKSQIDPICQRMGISKRDKDRLLKILVSQKRFQHTKDENSNQNEIFRKKDFFYEAFMVFKINALADNTEEDIQAAFFWEISTRNRPKASLRDISPEKETIEPEERIPPRRQNHQHRQTEFPQDGNRPPRKFSNYRGKKQRFRRKPRDKDSMKTNKPTTGVDTTQEG